MENLPFYIPVVFGLTVLLTLFLFYRATNKSGSALLLIIGWLILQSILSLQGFYTVTNTRPPRLPLMILFPFALIVFLFFTKKGRSFIDSLDPARLTLLHVIRVPVELVLWGLSVYKAVPLLMTFEGRNFDILSGLTAPLIFYWGYVQKRIPRQILLLWNFITLGLLVNILINGVLSAQSPFQQFAFDQPNRAILYFPFSLLPAGLVPLVLFSQLATIRVLLKTNTRHEHTRYGVDSI